MRALVAIGLVSFLPFAAFAALTVGTNLSDDIIGNLPVGNMPMPFGAGTTVDPSYLAAIDPTKAAGLNVPGMTGGLTHPACVAETARRAAMKPPQPPPNGDFPCMVPTSNNSGIIEGVCFATVCKGIASTGLDGLLSALGGISSLGSIVSSILGNLLKPAPSSASDGTPSVNPAAEQSAPLLITSTPLTALDMSKLFSDSAIIVQDLLFALNPPPAQTPAQTPGSP